MKKSSIICQSIVLSSFFVSMLFARYNPNLTTRCITHNNFIEYANFTFDAKNSPDFTPQRVKTGSVICIRGRDIPLFFKKYHPHIQHPYSIITHGEYRDAFLESYVPYLEDKKIIAWFGVHPAPITYPKFTALPLGIKIRHIKANQQQKIKHYCARLRKKNKKNLIYLNFAQNNPERRRVKNLFLDNPLCFVSERVSTKQRLSFKDYLAQMALCRFTFSPPGNAQDSYRTWESILVGSIPIVLHSELDALYKNLPIIIVNDWQEVTPEFLEQKYQEFAVKEFNLEKLFMGYWIKKIETAKNNFLKKMRIKYAAHKK